MYTSEVAIERCSVKFQKLIKVRVIHLKNTSEISVNIVSVKLQTSAPSNVEGFYPSKISFLIKLQNLVKLLACTCQGAPFDSFWWLAREHLSELLFELNNFWIAQMPWFYSLQNPSPYYNCWVVYLIFLYILKNNNSECTTWIALAIAIKQTLLHLAE